MKKIILPFLSLFTLLLIGQFALAQAGLSALPNSTITISSGSSIYANGNITFMSPTNSGAPASLIDRNNSNSVTASGIVSIERFLSTGEQHFFSIPVTSASSSLYALGNSRAYRHDETRTWDTEWVRMDATQALSVGSGYSYGYNGEYQTIRYAGIFNTGNIAINNLLLTDNVGDAANHEGWNLIGNPYPSALDWDQVWNFGTNNTSIYSAIYLWDYNQYRYYVPSDNIGGQVSPPVTVNNASAIIPAMQGFFVRAKSNGASITIPASARTHNSSIIYYKKGGQVNENFLRLTVDANGISDEMVVRFLESANDNFDGNYDAYKFFGLYYPTVPEIYSITVDQSNMAVNSLPKERLSNGIVPLGFKIGAAGTYVIKASEFNFEGMNGPVYLEDAYGTELGEAKLIELSAGEQYTFSTVAGDFTDRFKLYFSMTPTQIQELANETQVKIFSYGSDVFVNIHHGSTDGSILIYNMEGKLMYSEKITGVNNRLSVQSGSGLYIVKVSNSDKTETAKVFIK